MNSAPWPPPHQICSSFGVQLDGSKRFTELLVCSAVMTATIARPDFQAAR
jgi:hypothetical protein